MGIAWGYLADMYGQGWTTFVQSMGMQPDVRHQIRCRPWSIVECAESPKEATNCKISLCNRCRNAHNHRFVERRLECLY
jgi:hypothetical protein